MLTGSPADSWAAPADWANLSSLLAALGDDELLIPNVILSRSGPRLYYYNKAFPMYDRYPCLLFSLPQPLQTCSLLRWPAAHVRFDDWPGPPGRQWRQPYAIRNMTAASLISLVGAPSRGRRHGSDVGTEQTFAYASTRIDKLYKPLLGALQPPFFPEDEAAEQQPAASKQQRVSLWVGSAGTVAHLHCDASPNIFVQVPPATVTYLPRQITRT